MQTMRRLALGIVSLALMTMPTIMQACRVNPIPQEILESEYASGTIQAVTVAEITEIVEVPGESGRPSWQSAKAKVVATIYGEKTARDIEFAYNVIITNCGWPPVMKAGPGDKVVAYFLNDTDGLPVLLRAIDVGYAASVDEKMREALMGHLILPLSP